MDPSIYQAAGDLHELVSHEPFKRQFLAGLRDVHLDSVSVIVGDLGWQPIVAEGPSQRGVLVYFVAGENVRWNLDAEAQIAQVVGEDWEENLFHRGLPLLGP
jgi:hypothetical protein